MAEGARITSLGNSKHVCLEIVKFSTLALVHSSIYLSRHVTCRSAVSPNLLLLSRAERKLDQPLEELYCMLDVLPLYRGIEIRAAIKSTG